MALPKMGIAAAHDQCRHVAGVPPAAGRMPALLKGTTKWDRRHLAGSRPQAGKF